MKKLSVQVYSDSYKREVAELIVQIQRNEFDIPITIKEQPDLNDIPGFYQVQNGNFWIAMIEGRVIGTVALLDIGNRQGALRKMFVKTEYRGKIYGVGQALLNTLFDWAQSRGFKKIFLGTTEKFIAAHRFYEKNGFRKINKELLPKEFPIMSVDVKFYEYSL